MSRVLVITRDVVGSSMAGPAIRYVTISKYLSGKGHQVTLMVPNQTDLKQSDFKIIPYSTKTLIRQLSSTDVVIAQGFPTLALALSFFPRVRFIADLYDPMALEFIETGKPLPLHYRRFRLDRIRKITNLLLYAADFVVCANDRQRDLWLGMLVSLGLVSIDQYDGDNTLKNLIDLVPYGVRSDKREHTKQVLKGVVKGIAKDDTVLLWNGGVWNWFDSLTLIRAMAEVSKKRPDIKLFFLGTKHPNPQIKEEAMLAKTVELAKELGLHDQTVFFNFGWVPYQESKNYLLESDIGIATYFDHLETRFSFRTRFLDLLWAGKPIIATQGDSLSEMIKERGLGITVPEQNPSAVAEAILQLATDTKFYQQAVRNINEVREEMSWNNTLKPLAKFIDANEPPAHHRNKFTFYWMVVELVFSWIWNRFYRVVTLKI